MLTFHCVTMGTDVMNFKFLDVIFQVIMSLSSELGRNPAVRKAIATEFKTGGSPEKHEDGPQTRSKTANVRRRVHYSSRSTDEENDLIAEPMSDEADRIDRAAKSVDSIIVNSSTSRLHSAFSTPGPRYIPSYAYRSQLNAAPSPYFTADSEDENFVRDFDNYEVKDITLEFFYKPHTLTLLGKDDILDRCPFTGKLPHPRFSV